MGIVVIFLVIRIELDGYVFLFDLNVCMCKDIGVKILENILDVKIIEYIRSKDIVFLIVWRKNWIFLEFLFKNILSLVWRI